MRWADRLARWVALGWVWLGLAVVLGAVAPAAAVTAEASVDRVLTDPRIGESSGLAVSRRHAGVLWTHNDSGDAARLYAIGPDGSTLATVTLAGLDPRDWEAMASGVAADGAPVLWVGDIGDNSGTRDNGVLVHRIEEPAELVDAEVEPTSFRLRYPGPPVDAESLLVDPRDGRLLIVTKDPTGGIVYAAPLALDAANTLLLESLGGAPDFLTDGAFAPDGRMVVRGYGAMWTGGPTAGWSGPVALPPSGQGETLAVSADGLSVYVGSEGAGSEIWRAPLPPALSLESPAPEVPAGFIDDDAPPDPAKAFGLPWMPAALAGALAVTLSAAVLLLRRHPRPPPRW